MVARDLQKLSCSSQVNRARSNFRDQSPRRIAPSIGPKRGLGSDSREGLIVEVPKTVCDQLCLDRQVRSVRPIWRLQVRDEFFTARHQGLGEPNMLRPEPCLLPLGEADVFCAICG
jgi:hypothetical protein